MTDVVSELVAIANAPEDEVRLSSGFVCRLAQEVRDLTKDRDGLVLNHTAPLMSFVDDEATQDYAMVITKREAERIAAEIEQLRIGA